MKKSLWILGMAVLGAGVAVRGQVGQGSTEAQLVAEYGDPEMAFQRGGDRTLYYDGEEVVIRDDAVVTLPARLDQQIAEKPTHNPGTIQKYIAKAK